MSAVAASRRTSTEMAIDRSHVPSVANINESNLDDLNSDYEAFMQEINDIVNEFGCTSDDDELDQYIDQLENEAQKGDHDGQSALQGTDANGLHPSTQRCGSVNQPKDEHKKTNATISAIINAANQEEKHQTPLENMQSMADYLALLEEAKIRADEEYRLRVRLQHQFREEKEFFNMRIEQLQADNQTFGDHAKQIQIELSSALAQLNVCEQRFLNQAKELEELSAEKESLNTKLQVLRQNSMPLTKVKVLSNENKRLTADFETMKRRAVEAEVGIYMLKQGYETDGLKRSLNDVQKTLMTLRKIIDDISVLARTETEKADLRAFLNAEQVWTGIHGEIERILEGTTAEFDRYIAMIRSGTPLIDLPPIRIPTRPQPPVTPKCPDWIMERRLEQQRAALQSVITSPPPGFDFIRGPLHAHQPVAAAATAIAPMTNGHSALHRRSREESDSQQGTMPTKPRTQALFDGVATLVPNTTRNEIADAIHKAREALPQGFRALGLTGAIHRVAETVLEQRRMREQAAASAPAPSRRTVAQPQPRRLSNGQQATAAEIASATIPARKDTPPALPVETAAEKVSFFDAPKDDDCTICHEPFRRQVELQRCRVCHTVFHHSCLKTWLRLKKTCPICNRHMLLDEEFPAL